MSSTKPSDVSHYIALAPPEVQPILEKLRQVILEAAPGAIEKMSYGMPFYEYGGKGIQGRLIYFAAFKKHISLFIMPWQAETLPDEIKKYHTSKATYQFPLAHPIPYSLIAITVKKLVAERNKVA